MCKFIKAENAGNDYLYSFDSVWRKSEIISLCSRRFGAGADGAVFIKKQNGAYFLKIFNADGSEADFCGNACITASKLLYDLNISKRFKFSLYTRAKKAEAEVCGEFVAIKTERAKFVAPDGKKRALLKRLSLIKNIEYAGIFNAGNLHLTIKTNDLSRAFTDKIVKIVYGGETFKNGVNIEFFRPSFSGINCGLNLKIGAKSATNDISRLTDGVDAVVFERGSGYTYSCGSGALAVFECYNLSTRCVSGLNVKYKGGVLKVQKCENSVKLIGTPHAVYIGETHSEACRKIGENKGETFGENSKNSRFCFNCNCFNGGCGGEL